MFDDIHAFFHENAVAAYMQYKEARENPSAGCSNDLRLAMNAAAALYHFREHLPPQHSRTRNQLASICPDYDLLGDIVNAGKHRHVTHGTPQVSSAEKIYEMLVATEYRDEKGRYLHNKKVVNVDLNNGTSRDLYEIMANVINMWLSELISMGIMSNANMFSLPSKDIPLRSEAGAIPPLGLTIVKGLRFKQIMKLQRYNYDTGQIEPIDLTGSQITGNIYSKKPRRLLDFRLTNKETGEEYHRELVLTDEQEDEYHSLTTDNDFNEFAFKVAYEQGALEDIAREIAEKKKNIETTPSTSP